MEITYVADDRFTGSPDPEELAADHEQLHVWLEALFKSSVLYLLRHPELPSLYELHDAGKVRYQEEPRGEEKWLTPPRVLKLGWGDCEDIACWRAAELVVRHGVAAVPTFVFQRVPDGKGAFDDYYHIVVQYPDGMQEDPCRRIGMR